MTPFGRFYSVAFPTLRALPVLAVSQWASPSPYGIVDAMDFRFSTIVVAFLVALTLSACGLQEQGSAPSAPASAGSPAGSLPKTSEPERLPDSSVSTELDPDVVVAGTITWRENQPVLGAGAQVKPGPISKDTAISRDTVITAEDTKRARVVVTKADNVSIESVAGDPTIFVMKEGKIALIIGQPVSTSNPAQTWLWQSEETVDAFTFTSNDVASSQSSEPADLSITLSTSAVESAHWVNEPERPRLFITPSAWARTGTAGVQQHGWSTVVRDVPQVLDYPGDSLEHQFQCHAIGALDKATWNLETWYQDIGLIGFMTQRCNPL